MINWDNVSRDLVVVNEILSDWKRGVPVSQIEKDIVLAKLRNVYESVRMDGVSGGASGSAAEVVSCAEQCLESGSAQLSTQAQDTETEVCIGCEGGEVEVDASEHSRQTARQDTDVTGQEPMDAKLAAQVEVEPEDEDETEESLLEVFPVRRRLNQQMVSALYGDADYYGKSSEGNSSAVSQSFADALYGDNESDSKESYGDGGILTDEERSVILAEMEKLSEGDAAEDDYCIEHEGSIAGLTYDEPAPIYEEEQSSDDYNSVNQSDILPEVTIELIEEEFQRDAQEALSEDAGEEDSAVAIDSSRGFTDLRSSIGVNDKFLMVRDLFDGNVDEYNLAIDRFETFTELDDAMLYLYENYSWNPNDQAVQYLVDLLTRRLS